MTDNNPDRRVESTEAAMPGSPNRFKRSLTGSSDDDRRVRRRNDGALNAAIAQPFLGGTSTGSASLAESAATTLMNHQLQQATSGLLGSHPQQASQVSILAQLIRQHQAEQEQQQRLRLVENLLAPQLLASHGQEPVGRVNPLASASALWSQNQSPQSVNINSLLGAAAARAAPQQQQQRQPPPLALQDLLASQLGATYSQLGMLPAVAEQQPRPVDTASANLQALRNLLEQQQISRMLGTASQLQPAGNSMASNLQPQPPLSSLDILRLGQRRSNGPPRSTGICLSRPADTAQLPGYQAHIRKHLEFFAASQEDVDTPVQGRKKRVLLGQVGIRCRHCADIPIPHRGRGSVYYPQNLSGVYQSALNMSASHLLESCMCMPDAIRQELLIERQRRDIGCGGKAYWYDSCKELGLKEDEHGLWFE